MSMRDSGWIQLFAETNQEAVDLHVQAFRLAEELSCPVMVCMDGFILTHAYERVDIPTQAEVDDYLPPFDPRQVLDTAQPVSMGAMVGPEAFTEVRYLAHHKQLRALKLIPELSALFAARFGRTSGGLFRSYRATDAETIVVALGSVNGTVQEVVDEMRAEGVRIGSISITSFRPFPFESLGEALRHAKRVVVLEKCFAVGAGGIVSDDVRKALAGLAMHTYTVIAGLGGRPITRASLAALFAAAGNDALEPMTFLDLNTEVVARELAREKLSRRSGPTAEAVLRQIGAAGPQVG
jgi:pyruvate ferredoxin oxidoreductase alpha subunit